MDIGVVQNDVWGNGMLYTSDKLTRTLYGCRGHGLTAMLLFLFDKQR